MDKFVPYEKLSKKKKRQLDAEKRGFPMSAAEDLLYYDDIMKGGATQHDMGRHRVTWDDNYSKSSRSSIEKSKVLL